MAKNITIKEGTVARNFTGVKKLQTNVIGGGNQLWIPEDEAADYCTFKKITLRQNGTVKAEDNACDGFSEVTVDIPSDLKEKVIRANGEYFASQDNCAGYSKVTVNVDGGGAGGSQHTVIFYAADRTTILEKQTIEDGGGATYHGQNPTSSGMRFVGWSPNPVNIRADMNCFPRFENVIWDQNQILDDWITIAQNVRTNPDAYNIGQWKLLELNAIPLAECNADTLAATGNQPVQSELMFMELVAKGVDSLEGDNGYAPTTWLARNVTFTSYRHAVDRSNPANWESSLLRKFLQGQFTSKCFPQDLLNYVRRIIKYTSLKKDGQYYADYPTLEWFFVPSTREVYSGVTDWDASAQWNNVIEHIGATYPAKFGDSVLLANAKYPYTAYNATSIVYPLLRSCLSDSMSSYHDFMRRTESGSGNQSNDLRQIIFGFCL